jgi:PhnB protein
MDQSSKFPYREMPSIAPFLFVRDGARAVEFYKLALGAEEMFRTANPDSMLVHLSVGRADFWVADEEPEHQNLSPGFAWVHVGADGSGGGRSRFGVRASGECRRYSGVAGSRPKLWLAARPPFGHHWEIGKPIA